MGTQSNNLDFATQVANVNIKFDTAGANLFAAERTLPGPFSMYTDVVDNVGGTWERNFGGNYPVMAARSGSRKRTTGFRVYKERATPVTYDKTLQLKRLDVTRDRSGVVDSAIAAFYGEAERAFDRACATEFDSASGVGGTGYDSVALFSASHPYVGSTSGTGSNLAAATNLSHANANAARAVGQGLLMENGEPMDISYTDLRVAPILEGRAREIYAANTRLYFSNSSGSEATTGVVDSASYTNVWEGEMRIVVDRRISSSQQYYWTMMDLSKPGIRPIRFLIERRPETIMLTSMDDMPRYEHDVLEWSLEGEYIAIPGDWQSCYRGTGTA